MLSKTVRQYVIVGAFSNFCVVLCCVVLLKTVRQLGIFSYVNVLLRVCDCGRANFCVVLSTPVSM